MGRNRKTQKREALNEKNSKAALKNEISVHLENAMKILEKNCAFLEGQFLRFEARRDRYKQPFKHWTDVYAHWLHFDIEQYESDTFSGIYRETLQDENLLWKAPSAEDFWKSFNCYNGMDELLWRPRFNTKARNKFLDWSPDKRSSVIELILQLSIGYILPNDNCKIMNLGPCANMVWLSSMISQNNYMVFVLELDRLPVIRNDKLIQYNFHHYIKILDFTKNEQSANASISNYMNSIKRDPDRWIEPEQELGYSNSSMISSFTNAVLKHTGHRVRPKKYSTVYLSSIESNSIVFDESKRRWLSADYSSQIASASDAIKEEMDRVYYTLMDKMSEGQSCKSFIELLESIPNFKIQLTNQEKDVIGSAGNLLVLGRSGTGKTTCAVLRLFATEIVYKYRAHRVKQMRGLVPCDLKFSPEEIDRRCGLHIIFATASPVLTNEVKRYYNKLNEHIKEELKKKEERIRAKQAELEKANMEVSNIELMESVRADEKKLVVPEEELKIESDDEEGLDSDQEEEIEMNNQPGSLRFMTDDNFPLFVTIRRLIFMIDATLKGPFFARNVNGGIIGMSGNYVWHNEHKGVLVINKEFKKSRKAQDTDAVLSSSDSEDSDGEIYDPSLEKHVHTLIEKRKLKLYYHTSRNMSFEVDFECFYSKCWNSIVQKVSVSPLVFWTEVMSYIKGSATSHLYPGYYLPLNVYLSTGRKYSLLSEEIRIKIWQAYHIYERWKNNNNSYDFQDVVNFILNQIRFHGYQGIPIHFMMVDEVQDLTPATLLLLLKITSQKLFLSGDTAQTIAKGVGFKFSDIRSIFNDPDICLDPPEVHQLSVNFRSHGKILDLANAVVSLIEVLFPQTIDKLAKEKSMIDGPMPMIITSCQLEHLLFVLFGKSVSSQQTFIASSNNIEFGCDQVVIVRNQESKNTLPDLLKHALCLTVYEAKGLEFEDVILYNFFTETEIDYLHWRVLTAIEKGEEVENYIPTRTLEDMDSIGVNKLVCKANVDTNKYAMLCTELKNLYVAITRPKQRLIIYDTSNQNRVYIEDLWRKLNVVNFIRFEDTEEGVVVSTDNGEVVEKIASSTTQQAWKRQGIRMLKHRFYEQAEKCFKMSGDADLEKRASAYSTANKAAEKVNQSRLLEDMQKTNQAKKSRQVKREIKTLMTESTQVFEQAAIQFEELGLYRQAAKCFSSAGNHTRAAQIFEDLNSWGQAAESYQSGGEYSKAGKLFEVTHEYSRAIDCYCVVREWDNILQCIHTHSSLMRPEEREILIKKYVPLALETLMPKVVKTEEHDLSHSRNYEDEMKPKEYNFGQIEEDEEEEYEEDQEDEEEKEEIPPPQESSHIPEQLVQPTLTSESLSLVEMSSDNLPATSHSPDLIAISSLNPFLSSSDTIQISSLNPFIQPSSDTSFEIIEESKSESGFTVLSSAKFSDFSVIDPDQKFENLQDIDPDDEWLVSDNRSVAESVHSAVNKDGSIVSDYSILDNVHAAALNLGGQLIRTRADIFAEDEIMRKIIHYVTMFSREVQKQLQGLRSAESLMVHQQVSNDWQLASLIDLDEISVETVLMILDTLEYFELYKLCLVVCNRYGLAERMGRYVVSLAHKFSNLHMLKSSELLTSHFLTTQGPRAAVAYMAIHNVLEMINPEYLSLKKVLDKKSLGMLCFQGLILLGYWKKTIYIMDELNSLAVADTFVDFKNFKYIYRNFNFPSEDISKLASTDFEWLPFDYPLTAREIQSARIALESVIWKVNMKYPITFKNTLIPGYDQFLEDSKLKKAHEELPQFPSYFKFNSVLWSFLYSSNDETSANLEASIIQACKLISQTYAGKSAIDDIQILDAFSYLTQLVFSTETKISIKEKITSLSVEDFEFFLETVNKFINILTYRKTGLSFEVFYEFMALSIFSPLGVRLIQDAPVLRVIPRLTHVIVHKASVIARDITLDNESKYAHVADLEGNFILVKLETVSKFVSERLLKLVTSFVDYRTTNFLKMYAEKTVEFDESVLVSHLKHAAAHYGENAYIDNIKHRLLYSNGFERSLRKDNEGKFKAKAAQQELKKLQERLDDLKELGSTDPYSEMYVQTTKHTEIKKLNRRIGQLKRQIQGEDKPVTYKLIKIISKLMRNYYISPVKITKAARNALLTKVQEIFRDSDQGLDTLFCDNMMLSYRLCTLCDYSLMFQELLRTRYKPVMKVYKTGITSDNFIIKEPKMSETYRYELAWADMGVYFELGCWSELTNSALSYLHFNLNEINITERILLIEKSICLALASLVKIDFIFISSDTAEKLFKSERVVELASSEDWIALLDMIKVLSTIVSGCVDSYYFTSESIYKKNISTLLNIFLTLALNPPSTHHRLYDKFCKRVKGVYNQFEIYKKMINNKEIRDVYGNYKTAGELAKELLKAREIMMRKKEDWVRVELKRNRDMESIGLELDTAWYKETKAVTREIQASRVIKKAFLKKRKTIKKKARIIKNPVEQMYIIQLADKSCERDILNVEAINTWSRARGSLRLLHICYKYLSNLTFTNYTSKLHKALDMHYLLSQYENTISKLTRFQELLKAPSKESLSSLNEFASSSSREIQIAIERFESWKVVAVPKEYVIVRRPNRKWNILWKQHTAEVRFKPKRHRKRGFQREENKIRIAMK
jgi:hypothetical protein